MRAGEFVSRPLFREALRLVVPADHTIAVDYARRGRPVPRKALAGEAILALAPGHQLRTQVAELCDTIGAALSIDYEGTSLDTLRQMVGMGLGLTFLPDLYVLRELASDRAVAVVPLEGRTLYRTIGIVWRRSRPSGDELDVLTSTIRTTLRRELPMLHHIDETR